MHNPAILELASSSFAAPHDLGLRDSGTNVGYISTGAVGAGIADIGVTGYGGGGGNSVTVTGRVGNVAGEFTLTKSGFSSEAASFVFGAAAFAGVGSNYYGEQHISSQPLTNYGDIVAYDANGNVISRSPGVSVTATPIIVSGVTYPNGNGGMFHKGTTGNIYSGPASSSIWSVPGGGTFMGGNLGPYVQHWGHGNNLPSEPDLY